MLALCKKLRDRMSVGAVTNDIFTREDGEFLTRNKALPKERIDAVETGYVYQFLLPTIDVYFCNATIFSLRYYIPQTILPYQTIIKI